MSTRFQISALLYVMVLPVLFGAGFVLLLTTPLEARAMALVPWMAVASGFLAGPIAWTIAPRLQAGFWRRRTVAAVWRGPQDSRRWRP